MKKFAALLALVFTMFLAACGSESTSGGSSASEDKKITFGATAGPYSDMVTKAIKPILEEKGYEVEVVEFSDYIQPNKALASGDLDANLFQHKVYMESFAKEHNLELSELIVVPTAPMGIYSNKFSSMDEIADGATIAIPNDPTNAARAFLILEDAGLITISADADPLTVSENDIEDNVKNLKFEPIEAGQLPRAVESVDLSAVPGNFALAANMNLLDALVLENMPDQYRNRVVVNTKDLEEPFAKDIIEAVESPEFEAVIDAEFEGFGKPEWMLNR
ncbi:MAG TPA: MetQ/NlpA family ABC transporter substrate-binding protein [Bacillus sp. (in: firmicutes)]|uniref:MetQ/NlpA family ABC transporter substrate-binding protein n=1 Tax=Bacillus litorisediminis TaxID=2922713 RepID=UPI001FAD1F20|nr:MetQ/NlpA family ABC transporter substrate-binding protein [Bacillus litorisediminis]HWO74955.1 MetQ/NlpA family ABC transporter substrate-binding protein [Bacillus sp. (in: firmicutes)]